ncbi:MAG TPA: rRNA maturation RNase YbeY [Verrucomicrobiae bacterium]|nr:rRNA maturation RNase YbeY [Verrucomicrobiae bacterium]
MNVLIANRQRTRKIHSSQLRRIVSDLLAELEVGEAQLGINLVSDREMTSLNETFLQHEGTTDVITFNYARKTAFNVRTARPRAVKAATRGRAARAPLHGEVFVCVDEAILQAGKFKTTWQSEVVRYIVHGVLHLLGYDDLDPAARRRMKRAENRLLRKLSRRFALSKL